MALVGVGVGVAADLAGVAVDFGATVGLAVAVDFGVAAAEVAGLDATLRVGRGLGVGCCVGPLDTAVGDGRFAG